MPVDTILIKNPQYTHSQVSVCIHYNGQNKCRSAKEDPSRCTTNWWQNMPGWLILCFYFCCCWCCCCFCCWWWWWTWNAYNQGVLLIMSLRTAAVTEVLLHVKSAPALQLTHFIEEPFIANLQLPASLAHSKTFLDTRHSSSLEILAIHLPRLFVNSCKETNI